MILIFGGSYNGKLNFCKEKYMVKDDEIFFCGKDNKDNIEKLNFNKKVICGLHIFVKECVKNNISALDIIKNNADNLNDKIIFTGKTILEERDDIEKIQIYYDNEKIDLVDFPDNIEIYNIYTREKIEA